jgi:hypothetical protein
VGVFLAHLDKSSEDVAKELILEKEPADEKEAEEGAAPD